MTDVLLVVVLLALAAAVLFAASGVQRSRTDTDRRLRAVEERVVAIAARLGVPEPEHPEVVALVADGRMVQAIAVHRRRTGASLVEAKRFVDEVAQRRPGG